MEFKDWLGEVDDYLRSKTGLTHDDFADGPSNDSWRGGVTPEDYARQLLEEAGWTEEE